MTSQNYLCFLKTVVFAISREKLLIYYVFISWSWPYTTEMCFQGLMTSQDLILCYQF